MRYQFLPGYQRLLHSGDDWSLSSRDVLGNEILHGSGFKYLKRVSVALQVELQLVQPQGCYLTAEILSG